MAATPLPVTELPTGYAVAPDAVAWTGADVVNGNSFPSTNTEFVLVRNSDPTNPYTFTVTSQPDSPEGRTADEGPITLAAGDIKITQVFPSSGWANAGNVILHGSNAAIQFAVFRLRS